VSGAPYRGRFAPSPTGDLHFGSLIAAVGSYLAARQSQGQWFIRIEDLDPPREVPGSAASILRTLEALGFEWDGPVIYQSQHQTAYHSAVADLLNRGLAFECTCSRTEIGAANPVGLPGEEARYPGWCRHRPLIAGRARAVRYLVPGGTVSFEDELQGLAVCDVAGESGDFVIRRRDGLYAYQLAVSVDDAAQGITEVVRGRDLLTSTCRQILLQRALDLPTPRYLHLPLAVDMSGTKLSKSVGSASLDTSNAAMTLCRALAFLHQNPPADLPQQPADAVWKWAIAHWNPTHLSGTATQVIQP
jgi:glutamyl-Q tRNA(Asp) synthetase